MALKQPSSITNGFFQQDPQVQPGYSSIHHDVNDAELSVSARLLREVCELYLPQPVPALLDESLAKFAKLCLDDETVRLMDDCERNQPVLRPLNTFGDANIVNPLITGEGWRGLKDIQTANGIVAHGYHDVANALTYNRRMHQFMLATLWSPSSASVSCPAAMTDGAAMLLQRQLNSAAITSHTRQSPEQLRAVLQQAYKRLTSFDPNFAWTSGQWMTERPGGSDVSRTETLARCLSGVEIQQDNQDIGANTDGVGMPLGPWRIDGFKWFSSATDADMVVLLAETSVGLSLFYAPMKRRRGTTLGSPSMVMNGVKISRLKTKLGTKGLPTAELEIAGMRAWLLGEEGNGVREISTILNATRIWTASGAVGSWARALSVAHSYAKVRLIKDNNLLIQNEQHVRWMADEVVKLHANTHLAFLAVALLGLSEQGSGAVEKTRAQVWLPKTDVEARALLRSLTPVAKSQCSLAATLGIREVMESLGGVGYCENNGILNIAKLFRDSAVNSIWEGTSNILAHDLIRAIKGKDADQNKAVLDSLLQRMLQMIEPVFAQAARTLSEVWSRLHKLLLTTGMKELLYQGRQISSTIHYLVAGCLLFLSAVQLATIRSRVVAERWTAVGLNQAMKWLTEGVAINNCKADDTILFGDRIGQTTERKTSKI